MGIGVLHCHCSNAKPAEVYTGGKIFARAIGRAEAGNFKSRMAASIVNGDGKALGPPVVLLAKPETPPAALVSPAPMSRSGLSAHTLNLTYFMIELFPLSDPRHR